MEKLLIITSSHQGDGYSVFKNLPLNLLAIRACSIYLLKA